MLNKEKPEVMVFPPKVHRESITWALLSERNYEARIKE